MHYASPLGWIVVIQHEIARFRLNANLNAISDYTIRGIVSSFGQIQSFKLFLQPGQTITSKFLETTVMSMLLGHYNCVVDTFCAGYAHAQVVQV